MVRIALNFSNSFKELSVFMSLLETEVAIGLSPLTIDADDVSLGITAEDTIGIEPTPILASPRMADTEFGGVSERGNGSGLLLPGGGNDIKLGLGGGMETMTDIGGGSDVGGNNGMGRRGGGPRVSGPRWINCESGTGGCKCVLGSFTSIGICITFGGGVFVLIVIT